MYSNKRLYEQLVKYENSQVWEQFIDLKNMVIENIREENAKNSGKKSELSIIKNVVNNGHESLKSGYSMYGNKFAFTDGVRILISDSDFGYSELEKPLKVDSLMNGCNREMSFTLEIADLKNFVDLNCYKRSTSDKKPYVFEVEGIKCGIDPFFAIDSIQFTKSNVFYMDKVLKGNNNKPYYQEDENGEFISCILPIYINI